MKMTADAILYYADNPVDFVEDVIRAKPDANQRELLRSTSYGTSCGPRLRSG